MPNYNFKCLDCSHQFQKLLPVGHPEQKCLECDQPAQKLLKAPGVQFKGSGFYSTDSKSTSEASVPSAPKTESKVETKVEKKPESKPKDKT